MQVLKSQLKKADKSGARLGVILGEQEVQNKEVQIKFFEEDKEM